MEILKKKIPKFQTKNLYLTITKIENYKTNIEENKNTKNQIFKQTKFQKKQPVKKIFTKK